MGYSCDLDCEIVPEKDNYVEVDNVNVISREYSGVNTSDIDITVDNINYTISAELSDERKEQLDNIPENTSDLNNDGDGTSPFATEEYVDENGGKIASISVNDVAQPIDVDKNVNISIPTKTSDITNDSGFINNTVNNLVNYYTKSETYTQSEVNALIAAIKTIKAEIVQTLPIASVETYFNDSKTIYLVANSSQSGNDYYDEYITVRNGIEGNYTYAWEKIGSTQIDLTNYVQKTRTIAGITLEYDITAAALRAALNVEDGAEVNVQSDWDQSDSSADDYIKNKPTIPTALSSLTEDSTHRTVTDSEKMTWDNKQSQLSAGTGISISSNIVSMTGALPYLTIAPSSANNDGLKLVVLSSEPATRYSGYIYIITSSNS